MDIDVASHFVIIPLCATENSKYSDNYKLLIIKTLLLCTSTLFILHSFYKQCFVNVDLKHISF
jgi:hypothetical protein